MAADSRQHQTEDQTHVGVQLAHRYQLSELLARGGLCEVYRGDDLVLRRPIAVKAVPAASAEMYREALRRTAALSHPAVIALYDAVEHDGWLYLVQEYVPARPLAAYITTGVPVERAVALIAQVARVVAYAHAQSIAHGDVTPAAVLVDRYATVRVNNVGLPGDAAYISDVDRMLAGAGFAVRAVPDAGASTPSPDEIPAEGAPANTLSAEDVRRDVWSMGALLWQLLTSPTQVKGGERRVFRDDVSEAARALTRRALGMDDGAGEGITTADALALALEALGEELQQSRLLAAPLTPPTLRAARDAAADMAGMANWPEDEPMFALPSYARVEGVVAESPDFNAPTDPLAGDLAATQPTGRYDGPLVPPRFSLPSRPLGEAHGAYALTPSMPSSVPRWEAPARGQGAALDAGHAGERGGIGLMTVLILGALLFIIFFVIGFMMPSLFAR